MKSYHLKITYSKVNFLMFLYLPFILKFEIKNLNKEDYKKNKNNPPWCNTQIGNMLKLEYHPGDLTEFQQCPAAALKGGNCCSR